MKLSSLSSLICYEAQYGIKLYEQTTKTRIETDEFSTFIFALNNVRVVKVI
jgi:hypothetical protein